MVTFQCPKSTFEDQTVANQDSLLYHEAEKVLRSANKTNCCHWWEFL